MTSRAATADALPFASSHARGGAQKAAILMIALGEARAAELLGRLSDQEAESLTMEIALARRTDSDTIRAVLQEALDSVLAEEYLQDGGLDYVRATLERSLGPERAQEILARLGARLEQRPFQFLSRTPAEHIAMFLRAESPQTNALVIANLHAGLAAGVLAELDPVEQADVARRIAGLAEVSPQVSRLVEGVMRERLASVIAAGSSTAGGTKSLAEILASAGRATERHVLAELDRSDGDLADEVRALLFTFEDIVTLDDRSIQLVLRELDQKDLALALRGVGDSVRQRIYSNMSERGADLLREEIEFQPPQRRTAIEEAQGRIVAVIRRLEDTDAITVRRSEEDDLV